MDECRPRDPATGPGAAPGGWHAAGVAPLPGQEPPWPPLQWLRLGDHHRRLGELDQACAAYEAALAGSDTLYPALLSLGAIHVAAGRGAQAEPLLRRCCAMLPLDPQALHALGIALLLQGRAAEAEPLLHRAWRRDPGNALCGVHLADAAAALGQAETMQAAFERARQEDPWSLAALAGLATCLAARGRRDDAIDVLEAATVLHPHAVVPAAILADMLARTDRQVEAERALRRALLLDPANHDASMALSVVLMRLHRHAEARDLLHALLATGVDRLGPLCNLATALAALGRQDLAVQAAREAIALAPSHPAPRRALCNALPYLDGVDGATLLQAARACAARIATAALPPIERDADRARRLRIGLLSGTLRTHPVGWLTIAGFEHLDPAMFDLVCFSPHRPADALGRRFAAIASGWEDTGSLDDRQLALRIRDCGIDVLIDLGGYGDLGRMPVCAWRAAPVQVKWVGMQNHSTGMAAMDWLISDRWETPAALAASYSEKLLVLADGYVCYAPPGDAPPVTPPPAPARGHITFGCYNNLAKITPRVIATWTDILRSAPRSRLILKTHQFNDAATGAATLDEFAAHGVGRDRIDLRGSSPHGALLAQYADIDVVLDPFPYSGGLTTCEALWMGVPTLTMPGETFASRHSASHMSNVGLQDWVVPDRDSYVARAIRLADDPTVLCTLRAGLRDRVRASPLCDGPRFGAGLGAALRRAWHGWCDGQATPVHALLSPPRHTAEATGAAHGHVTADRHQPVRAQWRLDGGGGDRQRAGAELDGLAADADR